MCRSGGVRRSFAAWLGASGFALGVAQPCLAQESSEPAQGDGQAVAVPTPMAELQLSLPVRANLGSLGAEASRRWWPSYWETSALPKQWQGVADADLRLNVETARWELGALSLAT